MSFFKSKKSSLATLSDVLCGDLSSSIFDHISSKKRHFHQQNNSPKNIDSRVGQQNYLADAANRSPNSSTSSSQSSLDEQNHVPTYDSVNYEICCLLAEGSQTCFVSNFSSMIELYEKVAECFDISPKEIMYCTLNTPKVDMDHVLSGQICLNDIVFVHRKGARKEVEVTKTENFLGLTIADNGNGCSYIKKIKEDSTASRVPFIKVGDHIESIMNESMIGCRHYEVARFLKNIPLGQIFTIKLIEPVSSGFQLLSPRKTKTSAYSDSDLSNGKGTLRIRNNNVVEVLETSDNAKMQLALVHINKQLEQFIGINDDELAEELWLMALDHNPHEFSLCVANSDLNEFKFSDGFIFDIWAIVDDVLNGRLTSDQ